MLTFDYFAGGGGASCGIEAATGRSPDVAINHDEAAIAMHAINHPKTTHHRTDVWDADPVRDLVGGPVGLLWLSPDCLTGTQAQQVARVGNSVPPPLAEAVIRANVRREAQQHLFKAVG